jgi:hypothetical protein
MARPQVVDGEDGLRLWRVAVNVLNKQSLRADKGWWVVRSVTTHHKKVGYEMLRKISDFNEFFGTPQAE